LPGVSATDVCRLRQSTHHYYVARLAPLDAYHSTLSDAAMRCLQTSLSSRSRRLICLTTPRIWPGCHRLHWPATLLRASFTPGNSHRLTTTGLADFTAHRGQSDRPL